MSNETISFLTETTLIKVNKKLEKFAILKLEKSGNERACSVTCRASCGEKFTAIFDFDDTVKALMVPLEKYESDEDLKSIKVSIMIVSGTKVRKNKNNLEAVIEFCDREEVPSVEPDYVALVPDILEFNDKFGVIVRKHSNQFCCDVVLEVVETSTELGMIRFDADDLEKCSTFDFSESYPRPFSVRIKKLIAPDCIQVDYDDTAIHFPQKLEISESATISDGQDNQNELNHDEVNHDEVNPDELSPGKSNNRSKPDQSTPEFMNLTPVGHDRPSVMPGNYETTVVDQSVTDLTTKLTLTPKPFTVQTRDSGVYDESLVFDEKTLDHQVSIAKVSEAQNPQTSNSHVSNKQTLETKIPQVYGSITQASTIRDQQTNSQVQLAQVIQVKPLISPKPRYSQKPEISPKPKVVKAFTLSSKNPTTTNKSATESIISLEYVELFHNDIQIPVHQHTTKSHQQILPQVHHLSSPPRSRISSQTDEIFEPSEPIRLANDFYKGQIVNRETLLNDDDKVEVFGSNPIDLIQEMRESLRGSKDNSDTISLEEDSEMENQMNYVDTKQFWLEMERRSRAGSNRSVLN